MSDFFQRIRERKVFQVFLVYLGIGWALAEVSEFIVDNYGLSQRFLHVAVFVIVMGLPAALVLAWFHGEKGHQRMQRVEGVILATLLAVAVVGSLRIASRGILPTVTADDVFADLGDASVAVLPFENRLADPALEWLSTGVSELLTTGLAQVASLRVVSGQRLFDLARQEGVEGETRIPGALASRIAIRSGAHYMVEGSILGSNDDMTINASLIDVRDGGVVAAAKARGPDVFALIDSVTAALAGQVLGAARPTELAPVSSVATGNLDAFREYQLGLEAHRRYRWTDALAHYHRAIERDPNFALAYLNLALVQFFNGDFTQGSQNVQRAADNLTAASERDRLFLDGMLALLSRNDRATARVKLQELIDKYPDEKEGRAWLWRLSSGAARRRLLEDALKLDPFNATALNELAYDLARQGDFAAADSVAALYVEQQPEEPNPRDTQGEIFEQSQNYAAARGAYLEALALDPGFVHALDHLTRAYLRVGLAVEAREALAPFTTSAIPEARVEALLLTADTYMWQGDFDAALASITSAADFARALERADLESRALSTWLIPLALHTHRFDDSEPAFARLREIDPFNPKNGINAVRTLGEAGQLEEMAALRDVIERALASDPRARSFLAVLAPALDATVESYRGNLEQAVSTPGLGASIEGLGGLGVQYYPNLRPLIELGRGEEALRVAEDMERRLTAIGAGFHHFDPLDYHLALYFQGRAYELLADTARAEQAYRSLVDDWGPSLDQVPGVADAAARLEALQPN